MTVEVLIIIYEALKKEKAIYLFSLDLQDTGKTKLWHYLFVDSWKVERDGETHSCIWRQ